MRTCANKAHGLGGRGGYEPLPEAGEYVCDCYEHGTGEPWAHVGSRHVHERVVRCRDCRHGHITIDGESCKWCDLIATHDIDGNEPNNGYDPEPYFDADFFCAWGERRAQ